MARDKWSDRDFENCFEIRPVTRIRIMWVQSQIWRQWLKIGVLQGSKISSAFCKICLPNLARDESSNHDSQNCSEISAVAWFRICPILLHFQTFMFFTPPYCGNLWTFLREVLGIRSRLITMNRKFTFSFVVCLKISQTFHNRGVHLSSSTTTSSWHYWNAAKLRETEKHIEQWTINMPLIQTSCSKLSASKDAVALACTSTLSLTN